MYKKGRVYYGNALAGFIAETDEGYEFVYDKAWLGGINPRPVSLTLPLQDAAYKSKTLFAFFDGLIPEGWLLDLATEHWKLRANDRFELLLLTCGDAIGAVSVVPETNTN